jgi:hypothetical protein
MGDGTQYRYGWARLDSASGGYLVWIFRAPGQSDFVRVDYLDAMHERRPSYGRPEDNALINAIDAARYARARIDEKIHGYGCACSDCGKKREDKKATKPIVYLSCQYCHKPAGDQQTKESGVCQDCKQKMVDEGHAREANKSYQKPAVSILDQWEPAPGWAKDAKRKDSRSVNNTTMTGPDGLFPAFI